VAEVEGGKQLALAFAAMSPTSLDTPGPHFLSAAEWFGLAGAISVGAGAMSGGGSGGSYGGAPRGSAPTALSSGGTVAAGPVNKQNVQRFATGGLVTGPTMAMIGDSYNKSAGQNEAVIPLDDEGSISKIKDALGGGGTHIHVNVKGLISGDNLNKVVQQINKRVNKGQSRLLASDSQRVTRRSQ